MRKEEEKNKHLEMLRKEELKQEALEEAKREIDNEKLMRKEIETKAKIDKITSGIKIVPKISEPLVDRVSSPKTEIIRLKDRSAEVMAEKEFDLGDFVQLSHHQ
jgi:hypothetical protein